MDYKMTPVQMEEPAQEKPILVYAGFWKRFVAALIDGILLSVVFTIISMAFFGGAMMTMGPLRHNDPAAAAAVMSGIGMYYLMTIAVSWLYSALMESSPNQATLGKMALGLRVTDLEGKRISFGRASGRYFSKFASAIILMIGYIMAGFTTRKQALHDMIAGTLVVGKSSTVPANVAANVYRSEAVSA
jgi:uncharacterized RDD family membrane protein YckC